MFFSLFYRFIFSLGIPWLTFLVLPLFFVSHWQTDRQTDRNMDKQRDRQTDRQNHRQTGRQTDRNKDKKTHIQSNRQTHRPTDEPTLNKKYAPFKRDFGRHKSSSCFKQESLLFLSPDCFELIDFLCLRTKTRFWWVGNIIAPMQCYPGISLWLFVNYFIKNILLMKKEIIKGYTVYLCAALIVHQWLYPA